MRESVLDVLKVSYPVGVAVTSLAGYRWDTLSYQLAAICSVFVIIQQIYRLYQWAKLKWGAFKHRHDADYPPDAGA